MYQKRYTFSQDSLVQFRGVGTETSTEAFKEFVQPYLDENCYIYREEADNQVVIRFTTGAMAAKAIEELKGKPFMEKPLKMTILRGKKANIMWTKIKVLLQKEEAGKREREHNESSEPASKKVEEN